MNNYDCQVIQDLLVLYQDDICSGKSKQIVEEHLSECNTCKNYLEELKKEISYEIGSSIDDGKSIKSLKRRILKRNILITLLSLLCTFTLTTGVLYYFFNHESIMPYTAIGTISVTKSNNSLYFEISEGGIYRVYPTKTIKIDEDEQEYIEIKISCTKTPYTKRYKEGHNFIYEIGNQELPIVIYYEDQQNGSLHLISKLLY